MADTTETLKKLVASLEKSIKSKTDVKDKLVEKFESESGSRGMISDEIEKIKAKAKQENRKFTSGEAGFVTQHTKSVATHDKVIDVLHKKIEKVSQEISPLEFKLKNAKDDLKLYVAEKAKLDKKDKEYEKKKKELKKKLKTKL